MSKPGFCSGHGGWHIRSKSVRSPAPCRCVAEEGVKMFQLPKAPGRKATSALTVLAAIGASGMAADVASAAVTEVAPTQAARGKNSSYIGSGFPDNWYNWLTEADVTYHAEGPGYALWPIDFTAGA